MPAEPYRLEAVLTLRQKAEDEAKEELARKLRALKDEQDELQRRKDALAGHQAKRASYERERGEAMKRGTTMAEVQRMGRFAERLREEEEDLKERIPPQVEKAAAAQGEVDQARAALVEAQKQKKAIEQHKEKWILEKKHERDAREANQLDELGQVIHQRSK